MAVTIKSDKDNFYFNYDRMEYQYKDKKIILEGSFHTKLKVGTFLRRRKILFKQNIPLFEFYNDTYYPLTVTINGISYRPNQTFDKCDFGTVPLALQSIVSPICAPASFGLHDSAFEFNGLWKVEKDLTGTYKDKEVFVKMTMKEVNDILFYSMLAETQDYYLANKAYIGVAIAGKYVWTDKFITNENEVRYNKMIDMIDKTE